MNKLFRLANNPTVRGVAIWAAPLIVTWIMNKLALKGYSNSAKKSLKKWTNQDGSAARNR